MSRIGVRDEEGLSQTFFAAVWQQFWDHFGPSVHIEMEMANKILQTIIGLELDQALETSAFQLSALRHLLFSAAIKENPALALDLLAHAVKPQTFAAAPHLVNIQRLPSTATVDEIVLILQDLLRAGIIKPEVVVEFNLSQVISRSLELSPEKFMVLLQQVLLRVLARCYVGRYLHDRATLTLRYLDVIEGDTEIDRQKDGNLAASICQAALTASEHDGKWVNRVATLFIMAIQGRLPFWQPEYIPPQLVTRFFDVALPVKRHQHLSIRSKYTSAALVWKAIQQAQLAWPALSVAHLGQIMAAFSRPLSRSSLVDAQSHFNDYSSPAQARAADLISAASSLYELLATGPAGQVNSSEANCLLSILLRSKLDDSESEEGESANQQSKEAIMDIAAKMYALYIDVPTTISDTFILSTSNLIPLAEVISKSSATEAARVIRAYLGERRGRSARLLPIELTTAARAFFMIGDRGAGLAVFTQLIQQMSVPDAVDLRIILRDVVENDAQSIVAILEEMVQVGYTLDFDTATFLFAGIDQQDSVSQAAFIAFLGTYTERLPDAQRILNHIHAKARNAGIASRTYALLSESEGLLRRSAQEPSLDQTTLQNVKVQLTTNICQLLDLNHNRGVKALLDVAIPRGLVGLEAIHAFLAGQPDDLNKATRRKMARSLRGMLWVSLLRLIEQTPSVLAEDIEGKDRTVYAQARRVCLLLGDSASAYKVWQAGQSLETPVTLQVDDIEAFAAVLVGKTRAEREKWLFGDELERLKLADPQSKIRAIKRDADTV
jgi:hypothetical protein